MVRTQLQIDETTYEALREIAHRRHKSMSFVVREILREYLQPEQKAKRCMPSFVGAGASGRSDISVRHDEALAEDFK